MAATGTTSISLGLTAFALHDCSHPTWGSVYVISIIAVPAIPIIHIITIIVCTIPIIAISIICIFIFYISIAITIPGTPTITGQVAHPAANVTSSGFPE